MAKSKVTQNEPQGQEPIKHFQLGVVDWCLFSDFWTKQDELIKKLRFILFNSDLDADWGLNIIHDLIDMGEKDAHEFWERAKSQKHDSGGNDIITLKNQEAKESPETAT